MYHRHYSLDIGIFGVHVDTVGLRGYPSMTEVPSYIKVLTLGARGTERALVGPVVVQEKIDGSQFSFGVDADGNIGCRSHHKQLSLDSPTKMFAPAVEHVLRMTTQLSTVWRLSGKECWFYCEYLQKPKHNTLIYERVPKNHLALFNVDLSGAWCDRYEVLESFADLLEIDVVPELHRGEITIDELKALLTTPSFLGGELVEGVVIKNYNELIALGGRTYNVFCKLVNEKFKERHQKDWKKRSSKGKIEVYLESFRAEARWIKAVQRMREEGILEHQPRDIGTLVKLVQADIKEEETENIKEELYRLYIGAITRTATRGLAEWYKAQLLEAADASTTD